MPSIQICKVKSALFAALFLCIGTTLACSSGADAGDEGEPEHAEEVGTSSAAIDRNPPPIMVEPPTDGRCLCRVCPYPSWCSTNARGCTLESIPCANMHLCFCGGG
ncbi:hypothetical protein EON77_13455 [bacterium]|nr:MAG: hypothetical protein EON77_13455 [bacterium]